MTLLFALSAGCIDGSSPVAPVSQRESSRVKPYVDPDAELGTLEGELRRGSPLPADAEGLDPTKPWPNVRVDILDATGQPVAVASSDELGLFHVSLSPGSYRVTPRWPVTPLFRNPAAPPATGVSVTSGATAKVRLVYNPGTF